MAVFILIRPDDTMVRAVLALHLAVTTVGPMWNDQSIDSIHAKWTMKKLAKYHQLLIDLNMGDFAAHTSAFPSPELSLCHNEDEKKGGRGSKPGELWSSGQIRGTSGVCSTNEAFGSTME
jgi:hypothetical protein